MKPVIIHGQARAELDQAMAYYERQKSGLGLDLQAEVELAVARLQANPGLGSPYKGTRFRHWVLQRFPFVIYYTELAEAVWVMAISHQSRRPDYWRRRRRE